ncbi:hypothetical protein [Spirosoma fluminis]
MQQHTMTALAVNGLLITCLLSACQTEKLVSPVGSSAQAPDPAATLTSADGAPTRINRKLIKHDGSKLLYNADDRLWKIIDNPNEYTEYSYSPGTLVSIHYKNGQKTSQITHTLNADGRCTSSKHVSALDNKTYKYEYNAQGRLSKRYNANAVNERHEYEYDGNGELVMFKTFDSGNLKGVEITFGYSVPGEPIQVDRYRLNSVLLAPLDEHLPIFGAFTKHLIRRVTYKACGNNDVVEYLYTYTLNNDGLATEQKITNMATNALVWKSLFAYSGYGLIQIN